MDTLIKYMTQHFATDSIGRGLDGAVAGGAVLTAGLVYQVHQGADIELMFDALDNAGIAQQMQFAEKLRVQLYALLEQEAPKREPKPQGAPQVDVAALQAQMAAMQQLLAQALATKK